MTDRAGYPSASLRLAAGAAVVALCAALAGVSISDVVSGAGANAPEKTIPTLPPSTDDVATSSAPPTTVAETTEPVATTEPVETGIAVRAGATLSELFAAANAVFGSNGDIASGLGRFAIIPDGIPTPAGASIQGFTVDYFAEPGYYVASSRFSTSASADDVAIYYETMLTAAGFDLRLESDPQAEPRRIEFDSPTSVYGDASVGVVIDTSDGVVVELEVSDHADVEVLAAFAGWPAGMPTIDDGRPVEASVSATRDSQITLVVSTTFAYDDVTPDELTSRVREAVADGAGGFQLAEADDGGPNISLDHRLITSPAAVVSTMSSDADEVTTLELSGSLTL